MWRATAPAATCAPCRRGSRDAGARRCAGHSRHGFRAGPAQSGSRHPGLAARLHRPQSRPGAGSSRATCNRRKAAAPAKSSSSARNARPSARSGGSSAAAQFAVLLVPDAIENCGLRKVGMRRSATTPDVWEIYVSAHNYGDARARAGRCRSISARRERPRSPARGRGIPQRITLPAGRRCAKPASNSAAGRPACCGVNLTPHDAFPADDRADLDLPAQPVLPVTVYSSQPDLLRPLLAATRAWPPSIASRRNTAPTTAAW